METELEKNHVSVTCSVSHEKDILCYLTRESGKWPEACTARNCGDCPSRGDRPASPRSYVVVKVEGWSAWHDEVAFGFLARETLEVVVHKFLPGILSVIQDSKRVVGEYFSSLNYGYLASGRADCSCLPRVVCEWCRQVESKDRCFLDCTDWNGLSDAGPYYVWPEWWSGVSDAAGEFRGRPWLICSKLSPYDEDEDFYCTCSCCDL